MRWFLQTWRAKGLLFSLSDEGVNAHHVPAFKLACQAGRSRGANQFAFDESRAMLCVAAKRRLILSHYNGEPFSANMMTLQAIVCQYGDNLIALGTSG